SPKNFWRAFMRPGTSWVARGTLIISAFMVINAIHIFFWIFPLNSLVDASGARHFIGLLGMMFAFGTMIYTGILLGANRPIAFWSTAMVPLLFLVSALSTGIMAVMLVSKMGGASHGGVITSLARIDMVLILLEMFVIGIYLQATHRVPESRASAKLVLGGAVAPLFWFGVAILGLLLPFILEIAGTYYIPGAGAGVATVVATVSGLIGGLCLRQVVLKGGILAPLRAGRFEYALPMM
ncbi:MAG: NrfD/PsrC family molybdoenzyme membrane anchor subunit, partial [Candidatus Latescibacterota bacterium]